MAYGKNNSRKDWLMRAVPLAVGELSLAKRQAFYALRADILALMREMASAGFSPEPLDDHLRGPSLDARLLAVQTANTSLNSVWREQARMRVKPALKETEARYFKRLAGSLRFVDAEIPVEERHPSEDGSPPRRYYQIPVSVQDTITPDELQQLKRLGNAGKGVEVFRQ